MMWRRCGSPLLHEILPGHFQRRLDRFRSAAHQIDVIEPVGRIGDEAVGKPFRRLGGEEAGMGICYTVELRVEGGEHIRMSVTEAGDGGSPGGVDIGPALGIEEPDAFAADGDRQLRVDGAVEKMGHGALLELRDWR